RGNKGDTGATGPQGPIGPTGATGPQGEVGATGPTGPTGPQGEKGPQGLKGDTGDRGPKGDQGLKGEQGSIGPIGPQGERGPVGPKGDKGDKGKDGTGINILGSKDNVSQLPVTGKIGDGYLINGDLYVWSSNNNWTNVGNIKGPKGDQGSKGDIGPVGPKGDTGERGPKGDTGERGLGFSLKGEYNYITTYYKNDVVNYIGEAYGCISDTPITGINPYDDSKWITIVNKGEQGDQGPTGPQGLKGDTGERGPKGDKGDTGKDGTFNIVETYPTLETTNKTVLGAINEINAKPSTGGSSSNELIPRTTNNPKMYEIFLNQAKGATFEFASNNGVTITDNKLTFDTNSSSIRINLLTDGAIEIDVTKFITGYYMFGGNIHGQLNKWESELKKWIFEGKKGQYLTITVNNSGWEMSVSSKSLDDLCVQSQTGVKSFTFNGEAPQRTISNYNNLKFWTGTQSEYDSIKNKDATTLYFIKEV
ncbi:MAG: phage upper tail fiber protein, partial [Sarcina sp.]